MWRCNICNGTNVQVSVWIDANTSEILDDTGDKAWCVDCDGHVGLEVKEKETND